jgi:hypothetical protein
MKSYWQNNYSPEIGRFTTRDPIPTLELSPYVYVENNPVNYIDPSGESFLIIAGFIAVVGYAVCLVYGAASAINTYQEAFEQAIQSGRRRGELLDRLAEGDITPERLEALNTLVQDNLQNAAGAAWALYTSIPGTLKTGTLPTSVAGVIAGAGGSLMTSILSDGYVPDIDVIEERLGELTDEQREQFDRLHQALEVTTTTFLFSVIRIQKHVHQKPEHLITSPKKLQFSQMDSMKSSLIF